MWSSEWGWIQYGLEKKEKRPLVPVGVPSAAIMLSRFDVVCRAGREREKENIGAFWVLVRLSCVVLHAL